MKSTKHVPMLCRKCHGPMTRKLYCSKCKHTGRMRAYAVVKNRYEVRQGDTVTYDLTQRNDHAAKIIKAGGQFEIEVRRHGPGVYSIA